MGRVAIHLMLEEEDKKHLQEEVASYMEVMVDNSYILLLHNKGQQEEANSNSFRKAMVNAINSLHMFDHPDDGFDLYYHHHHNDPHLNDLLNFLMILLLLSFKLHN